MKQTFFSIITPTYNRADRLIKAFQSLNSQTFRDFEWVIIDDGSTDDTTNTVAQFAETANFNLIYHKIPHGGKHMAIRTAYEIVSGTWSFELDSDDELYDKNTLQHMYTLSTTNPNECFGGCFIDQHDNIFPKINTPYIDYDLETYLDNFCDETNQQNLNIAWLMKTTYARSMLPPPIQDNLTYFPEAVTNLQRALKSQNFQLRIFNQPWYRYHTYNSDSVTVNTRHTNALWYYAKSLLETLHEYNLLNKYPHFVRKLNKMLFAHTPTDRSIWTNRNILYKTGQSGTFYRLLFHHYLQRLFSIGHDEIYIFGIKIHKHKRNK